MPFNVIHFANPDFFPGRWWFTRGHMAAFATERGGLPAKVILMHIGKATKKMSKKKRGNLVFPFPMSAWRLTTDSSPVTPSTPKVLWVMFPPPPLPAPSRHRKSARFANSGREYKYFSFTRELGFSRSGFCHLHFHDQCSTRLLALEMLFGFWVGIIEKAQPIPSW